MMIAKIIRTQITAITTDAIAIPFQFSSSSNSSISFAN